jgi:hypothetical protein
MEGLGGLNYFSANYYFHYCGSDFYLSNRSRGAGGYSGTIFNYPYTCDSYYLSECAIHPFALFNMNTSTGQYDGTGAVIHYAVVENGSYKEKTFNYVPASAADFLHTLGYGYYGNGVLYLGKQI